VGKPPPKGQTIVTCGHCKVTLFHFNCYIYDAIIRQRTRSMTASRAPGLPAAINSAYVHKKQNSCQPSNIRMGRKLWNLPWPSKRWGQAGAWVLPSLHLSVLVGGNFVGATNFNFSRLLDLPPIYFTLAYIFKYDVRTPGSFRHRKLIYSPGKTPASNFSPPRKGRI
jgi:hypothetical protein